MNPHRGEASFVLDGTTYELRFTWNAAALYETAAGKTLSEGVRDVVNANVSATSLRAFLWSALRERHPKLSIEDAGRLLDAIGVVKAVELVLKGVPHWFPPPEGADPSTAPATPTATLASATPAP